MNVKWLQTLALSGLFSGAAEILKAPGGGAAPDPVTAGVALAGAVAATVIGNYLVNRATTQREARLSDQKRQEMAERNPHLRRGMAAALRRALERAREAFPDLPERPYAALFQEWALYLEQAGTDDRALDRLFPSEFAESQWAATNTYSPNPTADVEALASLLRDWLKQDALSRQWSVQEAREFAAKVLPFYQQAFADDLAGDSEGLLFQAFTVKGVNQIRAGVVEVLEEVLGPFHLVSSARPGTHGADTTSCTAFPQREPPA